MFYLRKLTMTKNVQHGFCGYIYLPVDRGVTEPPDHASFGRPRNSQYPDMCNP